MLLSLILASAAMPASDVIVTGQPLSRKEAQRRAAEYVEAVGIAPAERPAARWVDPVCPGVRGIAPVYSKIVEQRLREIAASVPIKLAKPGCRPNLIVAFSLDSAAFISKIAEQRPLRAVEQTNGDRIPHDAGKPVRWWYRTELRAADGAPSTGLLPPIWVGNGANADAPIPTNGSMSITSSYRSGMIGTGAMRAIRQAVVVIDLKRAEGVSLKSVSDYAALVGFAELRGGKHPPPGSVLFLFDGGSNEITLDDETMLRALYRLSLDRRARDQRGTIVREMTEARTE